jgi:hypothetical protein
MKIINIDEIRSIYNKELHVGSSLLSVNLKSGESFNVSELLMERAMINGLGLTVDNKYVLPYIVIDYINNEIKEK